MNVLEIHQDLFKIFETAKIKETSFLFKGEDPIKKVSFNDYFSKSIIETMISCLFQKGYDNLINLIDYKSIKGEFEIDKIVYEYSGGLKQELDKLKFEINSHETIDVSVLVKRNDNFNISDYIEQVKTYMSYDELYSLITAKNEVEVLKIEKIRQEIIQKYRGIKSNSDSYFKIEPDIIDKFFPQIFCDLKDSNQFAGLYKDFEKLISGITPTNKIGIKEITSMGTFVNWLVSEKLIPEKSKRKIDWKFIAENLYIIDSKETLISSQFSKNASRHHNNDVYSILKKHEAVIKSHSNQ